VDDGWLTGPLSQVGVDSTRLVQLMGQLRQHRNHLVHAILLVKDGVLVFEEYFPGERYVRPGVGEPVTFNRETRHYQASVSKSITAALVGIAHDRGLLDLSIPALSFFPELADLSVGGREDITLEDLLTMRSGLPWDESSTSYTNPANDVVQLFYNPDPIRYILSREMEAPAGTYFHYNSGATNVLGKVVEIVSGQRLDHLAEETLFTPLGIGDTYWELIREGLVFASGGLHLRPRDMAKIGQLYLDGGLWNGQRVLSGDWIAASRVPRSRVAYGWADGYGYGWWTRTYTTASGLVDTYFAAGWGEQQIIVVPDLHLVAVFTGGSYDDSPYLSPGQMMAGYVLPAVMN
jgi:CubicO group peptidase (beta-lactamase class C family)